jgi:nucleotide-binding universal stress UspA family protein
MHVMGAGSAVPGPLASGAHALAADATHDPLALAARLRAFIEPFRAHGAHVEVALTEAEVVEGILEAARTWPADVIVVGTRGLTGRQGWAVGSVTARLLPRSPCPVLAVPAGLSWESEPRLPIFERIVCPVDFSEPSAWALSWAIDIARTSKARLALLHIVEWLPEEGCGGDAPLRIPEIQLDLTQESRDRMRRFAPPGAFAGCDHEELVATGQPHRAILRLCRERRADLVVLGSHVRRAVDKALAGGTLTHLVREAGCPVLSVGVPPPR